MKYRDLRDFIDQLERTGRLQTVTQPVSVHLDMTELSDRTLRAAGPALMFTTPLNRGGQNPSKQGVDEPVRCA